MTLLADLLSTVFERRYLPTRAVKADGRPFQALTVELMGTSSEISGQTVAHQILDRYIGWDDDEKMSFFIHLAEDMTISPEAVRAALESYERGQTRESYRVFMTTAEPPRQEFIRRLNQVPGATHLLVRMREDLLRLGKETASLQALDLDFRHLFASWFNRGFLVLRPINWESPAHILEKIIAYEAVHTISSWDDLRRRVQPADRRCYAFFHPAMPDEPLIFVEVALTSGVPGSVQDLLAEDRDVISAAEADTAVFYSISNCQAGLAGISFGNSLIKQVMADLAIEVAGLKTSVTLSPIPGLTAWLATEKITTDPSDGPRMRALAAAYLLSAKRSDGLPVDPVARFHLGNGALLHQLHADADLSENGMAQSGGVMVNYLYDPGKVSANHERFATRRTIAASAEVRALHTSAKKMLSGELGT